jgi:hypothetical protein
MSKRTEQVNSRAALLMNAAALTSTLGTTTIGNAWAVLAILANLGAAAVGVAAVFPTRGKVSRPNELRTGFLETSPVRVELDHADDEVITYNEHVSELHRRTCWVQVGFLLLGASILSSGASLASLLARRIEPAAKTLHHFGVAHRLDFFVRTSDGKVRSKRWNGTAWLPAADGTWLGRPRWDPGNGADSRTIRAQSRLDHGTKLGRSAAVPLLGRRAVAAVGELRRRLHGSPAPLAWGRDRLNIFTRGVDTKIYCRVWDGGTWFAAQDMGGTMLGSPAAGIFDGNPVVAAIGTNGHLMYRYSDGTNWIPAGSWQDLGGTNLTGTPVVVTWGGNRLSLFVLDSAGNLFTKE